MANELRHEDVGGELSRSEWEAIGTHILNNQAIGDMIYAPSATQLSRLSIGIANQVLQTAGGIPTWASTLAGLTLTSPNINGVIGTTGLTIPASTFSGDNTWNVAQTGVTLTSPTINGTIATTGLTLPAVTLGGTVTINGQTFDAGSGSARINTTGDNSGLDIYGSGNSWGPRIRLISTDTSPTIDRTVGDIEARGMDGVDVEQRYGYLRFLYKNVTDTSEAAGLAIALMDAGAPDNVALTLSGAGRLWVDADIDFSTSIDSALVADHVSLGCFDIGGLRSLAISQENPVVVEAIGASDRTLPVRVNGTDYKIMLHT